MAEISDERCFLYFFWSSQEDDPVLLIGDLLVSSVRSEMFIFLS